jgi:hypothetical protein
MKISNKTISNAANKVIKPIKPIKANKWENMALISNKVISNKQ